MEKIRLAIFASGTGSNALKILEFAREHDNLEVSIIISNNPTAGVLNHASQFSCPAQVMQKADLIEGGRCLEVLKQRKVNFIALAGYLLKIPEPIIRAYPNKIVNLHPALLPKYGGKGMYGNRVHEAVLKSGDNISGITIHYVNENYDEGNIIAQFTCPVKEEDSVSSLASRIHSLEHEHFPKAVYIAAIKELAT